MWKKTIGIEGLLTYTSVAYILAALVLIVGIKTLFHRDYLQAHPEMIT